MTKKQFIESMKTFQNYDDWEGKVDALGVSIWQREEVGYFKSYYLELLKMACKDTKDIIPGYSYIEHFIYNCDFGKDTTEEDMKDLDSLWSALVSAHPEIEEKERKKKVKNNKYSTKNLNVLTFGYYKNWYKHPFKTIKQFFKRFKYAYQRITRGFADCDTWDMDSYLSTLISAMLKHFVNVTHSYPGTITFDEWKDTLVEMAEHFYNTLEDDETVPINQEIEKLWNEYQSEKNPIEAKKLQSKWYQKEREADQFRLDEKNKALDMLKQYYFDLWD